MTDALRYPSLRCVLEHMEANNRLHIRSRCPSLRKIDTMIPLRLNGLCFFANGIKLNDIIYQIWTASRYLTVEIRHDKNRKSIERRIPEHGDIHAGYRNMLELLLVGRSEIRIGRLKFCLYPEPDILPLLTGLPKFKVNFLSSGFFDFTTFLPLLHSSSFPLKELEITVKSDENLTHPILRTASKLYICNVSNDVVNWIDEMKTLPNRSIWPRFFEISVQTIFEIVEYWRDSNRDIGSEIIIYRRPVDDVSGLLRIVKQRFDGKRVQFKEEIEGTWRPISIPMSLTSELVIYGCRKPVPDLTFTVSVLVIKVIPAGSTVPISFPAIATEEYGTLFLMVVVCVIITFVLPYFVYY